MFPTGHCGKWELILISNRTNENLYRYPSAARRQTTLSGDSPPALAFLSQRTPIGKFFHRTGQRLVLQVSTRFFDQTFSPKKFVGVKGAKHLCRRPHELPRFAPPYTTPFTFSTTPCGKWNPHTPEKTKKLPRKNPRQPM